MSWGASKVGRVAQYINSTEGLLYSAARTVKLYRIPRGPAILAKSEVSWRIQAKEICTVSSPYVKRFPTSWHWGVWHFLAVHDGDPNCRLLEVTSNHRRLRCDSVQHQLGREQDQYRGSGVQIQLVSTVFMGRKPLKAHVTHPFGENFGDRSSIPRLRRSQDCHRYRISWWTRRCLWIPFGRCSPGMEAVPPPAVLKLSTWMMRWELSLIKMENSLCTCVQWTQQVYDILMDFSTRRSIKRIWTFEVWWVWQGLRAFGETFAELWEPQEPTPLEKETHLRKLQFLGFHPIFHPLEGSFFQWASRWLMWSRHPTLIRWHSQLEDILKELCVLQLFLGLSISAFVVFLISKERIFIKFLPIAGLVDNNVVLKDRWLQRTLDPNWPRARQVKKIVPWIKLRRWAFGAGICLGGPWVIGRWMQVFGFSLGFSDSLEMSTKEEHVLWYVYDIYIYTQIFVYSIC